MKLERKKRAESISKKLIGEFLIQELQELSIEFGIITIVDVKISSDLSYLDIYASALKNPEQLTKSLSEYAYHIHKMLGKKIQFIRVPKVRFRYDDTGKDSFEIYQKIQDLDIK